MLAERTSRYMYHTFLISMRAVQTKHRIIQFYVVYQCPFIKPSGFEASLLLFCAKRPWWEIKPVSWLSRMSDSVSVLRLCHLITFLTIHWWYSPHATAATLTVGVPVWPRTTVEHQAVTFWLSIIQLQKRAHTCIDWVGVVNHSLLVHRLLVCRTWSYAYE